MAVPGPRLVGPAHLLPNVACQPSSCPSRADVPLSAYGRALVEAVADQGLVLDLAHMNRAGFDESLRISRGTVVVSHTGIAGVHPIWRNLTGHQARAVADQGGVLGIIFFPAFLRRGPFGWVSDVVDHVDAAVAAVGIDHVALGTDFDGGITLPRGMRGAEDLILLTDALLRRGYAPQDCIRILGGNAMRVLSGV